jgi:two-component system, NarL family, invasion response regulator UvrY
MRGRPVSEVYLVDDHLILRESLQLVLQSEGHIVVGGCGEPTQAVSDLIRLQPQVLLLDLNLGPRSGFEVLEEVQRRELPVRTVVLTVLAHPGHVAEALRLGALAYLLKGASVRQLLDAVAAAQRGERYVTPDAAELALQALSMKSEIPSLALLSARERQVVTLVVTGHSSAQIGTLLHLSPKTVDSYRSRLMAKLGVGNVTALVRLAIRMGLIDAEQP